MKKLLITICFLMASCSAKNEVDMEPFRSKTIKVISPDQDPYNE